MGASYVRWLGAAGALALFGGAGWAAFSLTNAASVPASQQIVFLCLLVLIFYELTKVGGARRGR